MEEIINKLDIIIMGLMCIEYVLLGIFLAITIPIVIKQIKEHKILIKQRKEKMEKLKNDPSKN